MNTTIEYAVSKPLLEFLTDSNNEQFTLMQISAALEETYFKRALTCGELVEYVTQYLHPLIHTGFLKQHRATPNSLPVISKTDSFSDLQLLEQSENSYIPEEPDILVNQMYQLINEYQKTQFQIHHKSGELDVYRTLFDIDNNNGDAESTYKRLLNELAFMDGRSRKIREIINNYLKR